MGNPDPHAGRVGALRDVTRAALRAAATNAPRTTATLGLRFAPGDRVVDLVTGQELTVHAGYTRADLVSPANPKID